MTSPGRVLVVEDDEGDRTALDVLLPTLGYEVECAATGLAALRIAATFRPQVAVVDVHLPDIEGFSVAGGLRAHGSPSVLFLTGADTLADRLRGFASGADDYVTKPYHVPELLARIQVLMRRTRSGHSRQHVVGRLVVDEDAHVATVDAVEVFLSPTEFALLALLAGSAGRAVPRQQLVGRLSDGWAGPRTVDRHVVALRRKLASLGFTGVRTVHGIGYRLDPA